MRVRFLQCISGPTWHAKPGQERDVDEAEALRFLNAGIAHPVEPVTLTIDVTKHETGEAQYIAVAPVGERAVSSRNRKGKAR
jgi:hypothetical protein